MINAYLNLVNTNLALGIKKAKLEESLAFLKSGFLDLANFSMFKLLDLVTFMDFMALSKLFKFLAYDLFADFSLANFLASGILTQSYYHQSHYN